MNQSDAEKVQGLIAEINLELDGVLYWDKGQAVGSHHVYSTRGVDPSCKSPDLVDLRR